MSSKKNIVVMGLGYVGCVSAACLAEIGHNVLGVDRDIHKVESIAKGQSPFFEAGLETLIKRNLAAGRLKAGTLTKEALKLQMLCCSALALPRRRTVTST